MNHFTDQMHINRIRDALWQGREYVRAAVMVGAGFSLNAKPKSAAAASFPGWSELAAGLVAELYPKDASSDARREEALRQAGTSSGALRLAQEYKAAFGRDALDSFLRRKISDHDFEPGDLHRLLLRLPWSDVLTTNYDTLLERAAEDVVFRKYDVVTTIQDIPSAMKPRIVKLHGSFPSIRPFILTEEDFRTYPRRFAPFVNLAQQSMVENIFVLMGFSGDDPNFLYWTGWVRDNLGKSAPKIYLCGLLDLTTARRSLLHERNVVPVDLSPLFSRERFPDEARHSKAIEWLLLNLEAGEPASPLSWPDSAPPPRTPPSQGLPPIPGIERSRAERAPTREESDIRIQIQRFEDDWTKRRATYPGWLV